MARIKVSLQQRTTSVGVNVSTTENRIGVPFYQGIIPNVWHDNTLKGKGTVELPLGISDEILNQISRGGDTFVFEFDASQSEWTINHNLNKSPSVTVVDSAGSVITPSVKYIDANNIKIEFNAGFKGTAYLN